MESTQNELYAKAAEEWGAPLERLAHSYEHEPEKRRDLLQDIHLALWRSFANFNGDCSMRTWTYRVAHNVAAAHVLKQRRGRENVLVGLDALESAGTAGVEAAERQDALSRLYGLIRRLEPLERQVILLYLEGLDAVSIGEITGLSSGNVATRIHRIKRILADRFNQGARK
jgi:RNA polymerase sigma-70 factor (ECF subfamily)